MFKIININSVGGRVYEVKRLLAQKGYKVSLDGSFDEQTRHSVIVFQLDNNLLKTGIVDEPTWQKLNS